LERGEILNNLRGILPKNVMEFCNMKKFIEKQMLALKYLIGTKRCLAWLQRFREIYEQRRDSRRGFFSQNGEDLLIRDFFKSNTGTFIDIGASHPFIINNTYLLYKLGWRGINVEPNRYLYNRLKHFRPEDINLNLGAGRHDGKALFYRFWPSVLSTFSHQTCLSLIEQGHKLIEVYPTELVTLGSLSKQVSGTVDLLSIDVEGYEMEVLAGANWNEFRPKMIVIETKNPARLEFNMIKSRGYDFCERIGENDIFIRQ
jgi:FkbM family methyltransferase